MARPRKDPTSLRTTQVNVALSPVEMARLKEKAATANTNVTAFIRASALDQPITVVQSTAPDFLTRNELRAIGTNLNQIAKALNAKQEALPASLVKVCDKLDRLFDMWLSDDHSHGSGPQL